MNYMNHPCLSVSICGSKKGTIMVLVMIITGMIAAMGIAYVATTTAQSAMVSESIDNISYEQAAFSGFDVAKAYLLSKYTTNHTGWNTELSSSNSTAYMANMPYQNDYWITNTPITPVSPTGYTTWPFQWNRNFDYNDNTFRAKIEDNDDGDGNTLNDSDGVLKLTVEGWGPGNDPSMRYQPILLEGMISYTREPYAPTSAVVVGGSLNVFGNASIGGTDGSIQANGSVSVTGSASVSGNVTATGSIITSSATSIVGTPSPYAEETRIPPITPSDYSYLATHIFKTDGLVYDQSDVPVVTPTGWSYSGGIWSKAANVVNNGVYYFDGSDVTVSGSPGDKNNPMTLTLIATGYINVTGSPSLMANPAGGGIGLMAGTDLKMNGSGGSKYGVGLYAAHEQISLKGTPNVTGCVLAEDAIDNCTLVSSGSDIDYVEEIGGNASITYNGDLVTILTDGYPYIKVLGFKKRIKARY